MARTIVQPEHQILRRLLIGADATAMVAAFIASYYLLPLYRPLLVNGAVQIGSLRSELWPLLVLLPVEIWMGERFDLYNSLHAPWPTFLGVLARTQAVTVGLFAGFIFLFHLQAQTSRLLILGCFVLYLPADVSLRWSLKVWAKSRRRHTYGTTKTVLIGSSSTAAAFQRLAVEQAWQSTEIVGYFSCESSEDREASRVTGIPYLGDLSAFQPFIFGHPVDVVAVSSEPLNAPVRQHIEAALNIGLRVHLLPRYVLDERDLAFESSELKFERQFGLPVVVLSEIRSQRAGYLILKRIIDVVLSSVLLVLLAPVFALIALAIKLEAPRDPVLFPWRVLGRNNKPFVGYKFRTMVPDAERLKAELLRFNEVKGAAFKMRNDPRVTRVGRVLRRFSLDELPQLYSVWRGDMSLVGPRPPNKNEADQFEFWQRRKLCVKPGITCLWQVNGRSEIRDFSDWVRLDLEYIQKASLWLDCKILLKTIPIVLWGRGAY